MSVQNLLLSLNLIIGTTSTASANDVCSCLNEIQGLSAWSFIHSLTCFLSPPHAVPILIGVLVVVTSIMLVIVLLATFLICYVRKRFHHLTQRPMIHEHLPTQAGRSPVSVANYIIWKDSL